MIENVVKIFNHVFYYENMLTIIYSIDKIIKNFKNKVFITRIVNYKGEDKYGINKRNIF